MRDEGDLEMSVQPGTHWNHSREGYTVTVFVVPFEALKTKDANDARWQDAVAYTVDNAPDVLLVRPQADFLAKFTQDERLGDEA